MPEKKICAIAGKLGRTASP